MIQGIGRMHMLHLRQIQTKVKHEKLSMKSLTSIKVSQEKLKKTFNLFRIMDKGYQEFNAVSGQTN